jgi:hypothetical protein
MYKDARVGRKVIVDDMVNHRNVETPSSDVGDDEYAGSAIPKVPQLTLPSCLVEVSVDVGDLVLRGFEESCDVLDVMLGGNKDDSLWLTLGWDTEWDLDGGCEEAEERGVLFRFIDP